MANVWTQMGYVPPRGPCNFKHSIMSSRCPCLRFMLHPLKSSSSYECDGCSHHASFHSMENKAEDEIRKKWGQEAKDRADRDAETSQRPKKRPRAIGYSNDADDILVGVTNKSRSSTKVKGGTAKALRAAGTRTRGSITELPEEDADVLELD